MNQVATYIEDTLHMSVDISFYENIGSLPLYLRSGYDLFTLTVEGVKCLLAKPKEKTNRCSCKRLYRYRTVYRSI